MPFKPSKSSKPPRTGKTSGFSRSEKPSDDIKPKRSSKSGEFSRNDDKPKDRRERGKSADAPAPTGRPRRGASDSFSKSEKSFDEPKPKRSPRSSDAPKKEGGVVRERLVFGNEDAPAARKPRKTAGKEGEKTAAPAQAFAPKKYINVYLSLGSNMGKRLENLKTAASLIHKNIGKIARQSSIYETSPWGKTDQDAFLNQVLMINTILSPRDLLAAINTIERDLGRERKEKNGPRTIDIDILLYGKRIAKDKFLEIPHPEIQNRAFVLVPLMEIAPDLMHPVLGQQIDELYINCTDDSDVVILEDLG